MVRAACLARNGFVLTSACVITLATLPADAKAREIRILATTDAYALDDEPDGVFETLTTTSDSIYVWHSSIRRERGIIEFDISSFSVPVDILSARLEGNVVLLNGQNGEIPDLFIHGYVGNGVAELSDATVPANLIGSQLNLDLGLLSVPLDAAYVEGMLGSASYLGLSLRSGLNQGMGIWSIDGLPFFEPPPTLVLEVADVIYVDDDAPAGGNGLTWSSAFDNLHDALDAAEPGVEIWVAAGTYVPTRETIPGDTSTATFALADGVALYGGFAGAETSRNARDLSRRSTILYGHLGTGMGYAYHVVTANGVGATTILDGFTVESGWASGPESLDQHVGGGLYVSAGSPMVRNCRFIGNRAYDEGAAVANENGSQTQIVNCEFLRNSSGYGTGSLSNRDSDPTVLNSTFVGNSGGGVANYNSSAIYRNCILWQNGGTSSSDQIGSFSNADFEYCCIQGWTTPGVDGNINADPLFLDAPANINEYRQDLRLASNSPCVDAGRNDFLPADVSDLNGNGDVAEYIPMDLTGRPRLGDSYCAADTGHAEGFTAIVDMGAREIAPTLPVPAARLYVHQAATGTATGATWANALPELSDALEKAYHYACVVDEVWVAHGEYRPGVGAERNATFTLTNSVAIYGGFAGTESTLAERDISTNSVGATVLTGDIGIPGDPTDNCYTVVTAANVDASAVLDGFTISDGYADGARYYTAASSGGGIWADRATPTLANCRVIDNSAEAGGGLFCVDCGEFTLHNFTFAGNNATLGRNGGRWGGGLTLNRGTTLAAYNCRFIGNHGTSGGGGVACEYETCAALLANCIFRNNGGYRGGALYAFYADATVINCTFIDNQAYYPEALYPAYGGAAFGYKSRQEFVNCAFQGNLTSGLGGALALAQTDPGSHVTNCTITENVSADRAGGIVAFVEANVQLINSVLWNNVDSNGVDVVSQNLFDWTANGDNSIVARFSLIEDGAPGDGTVYPGRGNLDMDPQFVDPAGGDLRLAALSPGIDAGSNGVVPADVADLDDDGDTIESTPLDLDGNQRFVDAPNQDSGVPDDIPFRGIVDLGAYEFSGGLLLGDLEGDGDVDLDDYALFAECYTGPRGIGPGDVNQDGTTDLDDHLAWLACQTTPGDPVTPGCAVADLDGDEDADLMDFANLQGYLGSPADLSPTCRLGDFDEDNDVDLEDAARFQWALGSS